MNAYKFMDDADSRLYVGIVEGNLRKVHAALDDGAQLEKEGQLGMVIRSWLPPSLAGPLNG
jgi:hypothetical protein